MTRAALTSKPALTAIGALLPLVLASAGIGAGHGRFYTGPATFMLEAWAAAEFTASDPGSDNVLLDLTGGIGPVRDARPQFATDLQKTVPLAYFRAAVSLG